MKVGLVTSTVLHAAIITVGVIGFSAPRPFDVVDDSIPVDVITEAQLAELVAGDRKAPAAEIPAPTPTTRDEIVPDAQNTGNNTVDLETPPTPEANPRPVETAAAPAPTETPAPSPDTTPQPPLPAEETPAPVPATEVTPEPQPRQAVEPDPVETPAQPAPAETETVAELPETAPIPQRRPEPPKPAQTAKAPERKAAEQPASREQPSQRSDQQASLEDEVRALINQEAPSGGGARREDQTAALGNRRTTAEKLTASEMGALREQLGGCWSIDAGIMDPEQLKVSVTFNLDRNGKLEGTPRVTRSSGNPQFDRSAVRAIQKCDIRGLAVPPSKYETWNEVIVHFDPKDMFY